MDVAAPDLPLMLKWPNDLVLDGNKLAGILLERNGNRAVVGYGVNLATAPALPDREAASLAGAVTPQAFAPLLAASFARMLTLWRSSPSEAFVQAWLARAHAAGTPLMVHVSKDEKVAGRFAGLERDGALRLMLDDGSIEVVRAGDVEL